MNNTIIKAPSVTMDKMESLFIELTEQNCNLRCKHCYINFREKKEKDFIQIETIKQTLSLSNKVDYIYLTGGEPMLHPDFNAILRLCLKYSTTIIQTNALNINDKKARFLRKVEAENQKGNEIILMISIDHYEEKINDEIRGRGSYRKAIHAIQSLIKYDFNPILCIVNHYRENTDVLKSKFKALCDSINFETSDINFKIIPLIDKTKKTEEIYITDDNNLKIDCKKSRTLTKNGIFTCPLLSNDNRGKCGNNIKDFSNKSYLETPMCSQCCQNNTQIFSLDL